MVGAATKGFNGPPISCSTITSSSSPTSNAILPLPFPSPSSPLPLAVYTTRDPTPVPVGIHARPPPVLLTFSTPAHAAGFSIPRFFSHHDGTTYGAHRPWDDHERQKQCGCKWREHILFDRCRVLGREAWLRGWPWLQLGCFARVYRDGIERRGIRKPRSQELWGKDGELWSGTITDRNTPPAPSLYM